MGEVRGVVTGTFKDNHAFSALVERVCAVVEAHEPSGTPVFWQATRHQR